MKKNLLLICLFTCCSIGMYAQTQDDMNNKCCVFVGTYRSGKENCKPTMDYLAFPTNSEEESKEVNKKFRKDYPTYDAAYSYENGEYVVVIKFKWRNCEHEGVSQIYGKSLDDCKKIIDKRIEEGSYNYNYKIVYQWGDDTYIKAHSEYISGVRLDIFTHKRTGKIVRLTFRNEKDKEASVFILQPNGNHKRIFVPVGSSITMGGLLEFGTKIKVSIDENNVAEQMKGEKDWWDIDIIDKCKGEVRKLVTDPYKKKVIVEPATTMGIRG
jgi:hypothetical protein